MEQQLGLMDVETGTALVEPIVFADAPSAFDVLLTRAREFGVKHGQLLQAGGIDENGLDCLIIGYALGASDASSEPVSPADKEELRNAAFGAAYVQRPSVKHHW